LKALALARGEAADLHGYSDGKPMRSRLVAIGSFA
jgi:hypothetical protein